MNKKFKLCGILNDGEKINRYYDEGEAGILPLNNNEIKFFFVPDDTDLTNFDPENFSYVTADEWSWELNGKKLNYGVFSVNPCSVSPATSVLESEKTNVLTCTVKIGEVSYQAVYNFTVSSEPEVVVNKKFKLCGILNDGEKINRYYDEGEAGILPLNNNEIKFFFVPDDTDLTNFDPENFSYVTADEWRWELNGNKLDGGDSSVSPCSVSPATSVLEYEKTNVLKCTVKIGKEWYEAVYNFTVEQPVIVNLNTKFKLCGTLYNGDKLQHFYNYTDISTLPLNDNEIKFFFVPYETDLISFDPENFSYVPADEWRWELNGKKLDDGFDSVNSCSVSLATPGLEYEKTNVLTCTVKIGEVWYQAVYKFTVEKPAASANYNSYAFYVENKDYYNGYISAYNVDSRFVIPGTENNIIDFKFNVTADAGKTYLYYQERDGENYKIMCSQNKPGMELAFNSKLKSDTLEGTTVNWLTDSVNTTDKVKLIGKRIAYDSVTKKYWMLGQTSSNYYMLSTNSITEEAELQHYNMTRLINGEQIESLDGNVDFAVYNNYIVLYVKPSDDTSTKLHILKIKDGSGLEYIAYIDNVSICPLNIELTDIQAVGSDIYLLYGTSISYYYGDGHHSYGFVARLTYKGDDAAVPYEYDNSFGTVGLTANFSKETVIKMSDGYYSGSSSSTDATYFSYYGPTEEDADCSFFSPLYFAAIKDDYLYVIDDGFRKKEDSETGALANRDRLMKVSLRDKTVSVEKDGISLMAGNGSVPNIFEF